MNYRLNHEDLENLGVTSAILRRASLEAGTLELEMAMRAMTDTPVPWKYMDRIDYYRRGELIFSGSIAEAYPSISSTSYTYHVTIKDDWWLMELTTFARFVNTGSPDDIGLSRGGFAGLDATRKTADFAGALKEICAWCSSMKAELRVSTDSKIIPFSSNGSDSCAALFQAACKWRPDVVTRFAYEGGKAYLDVLTYRALENLSLSFSDIQPTSVEFKPRHDLVIPGFALLGKYGNRISPPGFDIKTPGTFVYAAPAEGYTTSEGGGSDPKQASKQMLPYLRLKLRKKKWYRTVKAPTADLDGILDDKYAIKGETGSGEGGKSDERKFWEQSFPELKKIDGLEWGRTAIQEIDLQPQEFIDENEKLNLPANYSTTLKSSYALAPGCEFSGNNKRVRFNYSTVTQRVRVLKETLHNSGKDSLLRAFFPEDDREEGKNYYGRVLQCRFCNINVPRGWEYDDQSDDGTEDNDEEEEPDSPEGTDDTLPYQQAFDDFIGAQLPLQWEGSITSKPGKLNSSTSFLGRALSIIGGRPEWATMQTLIQSESVDLKTDEITLDCGNQNGIGFDDFRELRELANLRDSSSVTPKPKEPEPTDNPENPDDDGKKDPVKIGPTFTGIQTAVNGGGRKIVPFKPFLRNNNEWWIPGGYILWRKKHIKIPAQKVGNAGDSMNNVAFYAHVTRKDGKITIAIKKSKIIEG